MGKFYMILVFLLLFFAGCSTSSLESVAKTNPSIILEDKSVAKWLEVENANSVIRQDGLVELEIVAKNSDSKSRIFTYKVDWYDANGFTIQSITSKWKIVQVEGKRGVIIREISPSHDVINYKLRIGTPNDNDKKREQNVNIKEYRGD